jgi:hypothetical protein
MNLFDKNVSLLKELIVNEFSNNNIQCIIKLKIVLEAKTYVSTHILHLLGKLCAIFMKL